jgi:hypothetical protein
MATKSVKTSKAKSTKTSAPKIARAKKSEVTSPAEAVTQATTPTAPTHDVIAARAYDLWCTRGFEHGHDVEDWLAAERDLTSS